MVGWLVGWLDVFSSIHFPCGISFPCPATLVCFSLISYRHSTYCPWAYCHWTYCHWTYCHWTCSCCQSPSECRRVYHRHNIVEYTSYLCLRISHSPHCNNIPRQYKYYFHKKRPCRRQCQAQPRHTFQRRYHR